MTSTSTTPDSTVSYRPSGDEDKAHLETYFEELRLALIDTDNPPLEDRTATPRSTVKTAVVCFLSDPVSRLAQVLEGGRQCPGSVVLAAATSWLEKVTEERNGKKEAHILLHKGITADRGGALYLDAYSPPLKITYFCNFFTGPATNGERGDGIPFEEHLVCPMSSSTALEQIVNDKLLTRILMSRARVAHPATLAFPFHSPIKYDIRGSTSISLVRLSSKDAAMRDVLKANVARFLPSLRQTVRKIVVKPSGPMWYASKGVKFFPRNNPEAIVDGLFALLQDLHEGDCLLCEAFERVMPSNRVVPLSDVPLILSTQPTMFSTPDGDGAQLLVEEQEHWAADAGDMEATGAEIDYDSLVRLSFRLRVLVARGNDRPIISYMVSGIGDSRKPVNGDNTVPLSLETTLRVWGMKNKKQREEVIKAVTEESEAVMASLIAYEKSGYPGAESVMATNPVRARTELIGIDFVMGFRDGAVIPVVIEVNDHDCTLQSQTFEFTLLDNAAVGSSAKDWIRAMIVQAEAHALYGKRVLYVGGGGHSKRMTFTAAQEYNIDVYVVDQAPRHYCVEEGLIAEDHYLHCDFAIHADDVKHCAAIVEMLRERKIELDGVITFWEDCTVLTAMVAKALGLKGNPPESAAMAKSKLATHLHLQRRIESLPHRVSTSFFAIPTFRCSTDEQVTAALEETGLPALVKIEHGSSAFGVKLCSTKEEVMSTIKELTSTYAEEDDHPGCGLGFNSSALVQQFVEGSEHDVDLVISDGRLVTGIITDNAITRLPYFSETCFLMPSRVSRDQKGLMLTAALQVLRDLGLMNGTFNVEMKLDSMGPKVIDVNGRMGGFYIREYVKRAFNIDLFAMSIMAAVGMRPISADAMPESDFYIAGMQLYTSQHETALKTTATPERLQQLNDAGAVDFVQFEPHLLPAEEYEEPFGNLATRGTDATEALANLQRLAKILGLDGGDVALEFFLRTLEVV